MKTVYCTRTRWKRCGPMKVGHISWRVRVRVGWEASWLWEDMNVTNFHNIIGFSVDRVMADISTMIFPKLYKMLLYYYLDFTFFKCWCLFLSRHHSIQVSLMLKIWTGVEQWEFYIFFGARSILSHVTYQINGVD